MDFSKDEKIVCEIKTKEVLLINYYIVILKKQIVVHLPIITFVKDGLICTAVYKLVQIVVQANDETQVYTKLVWVFIVANYAVWEVKNMHFTYLAIPVNFNLLN